MGQLMEEPHYLMTDELYSVTNGLQTSTIETPYDYSILFRYQERLRSLDTNLKNHLRMEQKILLPMQQLLGRWNNKVEFLFEGEYKRQEGETVLRPTPLYQVCG